jgi:hypothetical protein
MLKAAATFVALAATLVVGCEQKTAPVGATSASVAPSASGPPVVNAIPAKDEKIRSGVNPLNEQPYKGPTGSVRGTITAKGDQAPILDEVAKKIPDRCKAARLVYGRKFREGMMRTLGDALVAVTEYRGYIPAKSEAVTVTAKDCSWDQRFLLVDQMNDFMAADVFAFKYPTATVTSLDGKFEITGIPVGKAKLSALLPATNQSAQKEITIVADKTIEVNLEINYDKKTMEPKPAPKSSAPVIK